MVELVRLVLSRPGLAVLSLIIVTTLFAAGLARLDTETGYRAYLGEAHPTIVGLDRFVEGFGGGLPMAAVWSCNETHACHDVFDEPALRMAQRVVARLESLPGVLEVQSPATTRLFLGSGDSLGAVAAIDHPDLEVFREAALRHPLWQGQLVSEDGRTGALVIDLASSDSETTRRVLEELETALAPFEEAHGFDFYIVGQAAQFALTDESLARDSQRLLPITLALVALVVAILFRAWQPVIAVLATVGLCSLWTIGGMGFLEWPENAITQTIPPLMLVIAMCDAIHLLSRYERHRLTGGSSSRPARKRALLRAASETGAPCLVTTVTTAAGFLSFTVSGLESFVRFGIVAAVGIGVALLLTFTVVPLAMAWLPAEPFQAGHASERWRLALVTLVRGTRRRARSITATSVAVGIACAYGVSLLRVDVDEYKLYGEHSAVVKAFRFLEEHLRLPDSVEIELRLPEERSLHEPEVTQQLRDLSVDLAAIPGLGETRSLLDAMRWANQLAHGGDPAFDRLGETSGENAQILTLLALKDPAALARWAGLDFRRIRISVEARKLPQSERGAVLASVREALQGNLGPDWGTTLTGSLVVYHAMVSEIHVTQLASFGVAGSVVFVVFVLFLWLKGSELPGALGWAFAGMFTTLLPVVATLGVMGFVGIHLDMGTAMVDAIIIGIAVDDAVHLLSEFQRRRRLGYEALGAIEGAVLHTGRAVVTTSVALAAGFFVLLLSSWQSISSFGFLSGIAIAVALVAVLVVLPALVCLAGGETRRQDEEQEAEAVAPPERRPRRRTRAALTILALVFPLAVAYAAARGLDDADGASALACRVAPNGAVPIIAGSDPACPLRSFDRVRSLSESGRTVLFSSRDDFEQALGRSGDTVDVELVRDGAIQRAKIPVLQESAHDRAYRLTATLALAAALMGFGIWVFWHSNAAAAPALLLLAGAFTTEVISILCASHGPLVFWSGLPGGPLMVAGLGHLALTFPRERVLVRQARGLIVVPYVLAGFFVTAEARSLYLDPILWEIGQRFLLVVAGGAVAFLGWGSLRTLRESRTPLERARARALLTGFFGLPFVVVALWMDWGRGLPGGRFAPLFAGSALFLLAIGHSVVRYDLFDVSARARAGLARFLHYGCLALLAGGAGWAVSRGLNAGGPLVWAGTAVFAGATTEGLRRRVLPVLENALAPSAGARRQLVREQETRSREVVSEDVSAQLVGRTLEAGLDATGVAVFLEEGPAPKSWRPAYVGRESPAFRVRYARAGRELLHGASLVHLARGDAPTGSVAQTLWGAGVELIVSVSAGLDDYGLILVGRPRTHLAYSSEEVDFARAVAANAAMAIHDARFTEDRLAAERGAAVAGLVRGIAHDLGRPLRVIERRATRIAGRTADPDHVLREAHEIAEVARHLVKDLYALAAEDSAEMAQLQSIRMEDVVNRCVRQADDSPEQERIVVSLASGLPRVPVADAEKLVRILTNLLENALIASPPTDPVWLYATEQNGGLRVEIEDRGPGMSAEVAARAFDLYFTTRREEGGTGIGLPLAREMVEDIGGVLELHSKPGDGTRAIIRLPDGRQRRGFEDE